MGICTRLAAAALVFSVAAISHAATRQNVNYPSHTTTTSQGVATKGTGVVKVAVEEGEYIQAHNLNRKTPVKVLKTVDYSIPRTITQTKNLLKSNLAQIAISGAIAGAAAGVGWILDPANNRIQKKEKDQYDGKAIQTGTVADEIYAMSQVPGLGLYRSNLYWQWIQPGGTPGSNTNGWTYYSNVFDGNTWKYSISRKQRTANDVIVPGPIVDVPVSEIDGPTLDTYINGQTAEWLKGLLRDACANSASPNSCLQSLVDKSALSGPASVQGPSTTSTGTYTKPDGTTGTTSQTTNITYNIKYGPNYFDWTENKTVTNYKDGAQTDSTTTTDSETVTDEQPAPDKEEEEEEQYSFQDSQLPQIEPFYDQKYPDGLEGVWNSAKADFENSEFVSFMESFVPSFSGTCPSWSMNFAIGALANFGTIPFQSLCYVFDFIKVIILVTAVFTCRAIVFGG